MATYTDPSNVQRFALTGNAFVDSLFDSASYFRVAWDTVVNGKTIVTYSFPWADGVASLFDTGYGNGENTAPSTGAVSTAEMPGIVMAFQAWADVANLTFTKVDETAAGQVGDLRIAFTSVIDPGYWGYTLITGDGADNSHGDIWIGTDMIGQSFLPGTFNYEAIMHEIGHALGLAHPFEGNIIPAGYDNERYTIMSYTSPDNVWWLNPATGDYEYLIKGPMVYDIAAVQQIYGANTAFHAGATTYAYASDAPFFATIWDGGGVDTIDISDFADGCTINLRPGSYSTLAFSNASLDRNLGIAFDCVIENVTAGSGNDRVSGNSAANRLDGGAGDDVLAGLGGNDWLVGGAGDDTLNGGLGIDTASYANAGASVSVNLARTGAQATGGAGQDTLVSIENLIGSGRADTLVGNGGVNVLRGGDGADILSGSGGADTLVGGSGADALRGGAGQDTLTGGAGADRFVFGKGEFAGMTLSTADEIVDFSHAEGDRIALGLVDANATTVGIDDAFTFISTAEFGHHAGELRYTVSGDVDIVQGDTDGDGIADFWIVVDAAPALTALDFVL